MLNFSSKSDRYLHEIDKLCQRVIDIFLPKVSLAENRMTRTLDAEQPKGSSSQQVKLFNPPKPMPIRQRPRCVDQFIFT